MAIENDDAALTGGEQTHAPVTPAVPAEPAPNETARQTVRKAFEQAQAKAAERDEREQRAPRTPAESILQAVADRAMADGEDPGKPTLDRTRDQQGRFVRGEGQEQAPVEKPAEAAPDAAQPPQPGAIALRPPNGWNAAAKVLYANLPPEVKEAVAKREGEVAAGAQARAQELQPYRGLETYTPVIHASGLTHAEFTKRAVEWEQALNTQSLNTALHVTGLAWQRATDPVEKQILQVHYQALAQAMQQRGRLAPQQAAQNFQQQQFQQPQPQQPDDLEARIQKVIAERDAHQTVDEFLADPQNIHAETVADHMAWLIGSKQADSLEQAYDMACHAHPEIRALLTRQASATPGSVSETDRARRQASEARAAAKATVGAPSGPRPEQKDNRPPNATVRYDVRRAFEQVRDRDL